MSAEGRSAASLLRAGLVPILLFLFAALVRVTPLTGVLWPGRVRLVGMDAYYHMRRIVYSYAHFPSVLDFDPYINFPDGARPIWTPFFDWGVAALMLLIPGQASIAELEARTAWIPPLLGASAVVALYVLARRHFGGPVALTAALVLSVLSGHFWYSQIGFVDHHAAVALATTVLLGSAMAFLDRASREPASLSALIWRASVMGALLALTLLVWPGALFHVGLVEIGLLAWLLTRGDRDTGVVAAMALAAAHAPGLCIIGPFGIGSEWTQWSSFSPVVLSNFQPWFFAAAALFSAGCAWTWHRFDWAGGSSSRRAISAAGIFALIVAISMVVWPTLPRGGIEAWQWMAKAEEFQNIVAESSPLFYSAGRFTPDIATARLSAFFLAVPAALAAIGWVAARRPRRPPVFLYLFWTAGLCIATLNQKRFANTASVAVALLMALSLHWGYAAVRKRLGQGRGRKPLVATSFLVLAIALLWPTLATYRSYVRDLYQSMGGERPRPVGDRLHGDATHDIARWLRRNTPSPGPWMDPQATPSYGVVGPWGLGHMIEYVARRPTSINNFGDDIGAENFLLVRRYFASTDEETATEILNGLRSRYVISQKSSTFVGARVEDEAIFHSLYKFDGSEFVSTEQAGAPVRPALQQHRLIFDSILTGQEPQRRPVFKVFEYVRGARIVGRAVPGAEVRASTGLSTNRDREIVYKTRTTAGRDGRYELRVPYSNAGGIGAVRVSNHYTLECYSHSARVRVSEQAARGGRVVRGPDLCEHEARGPLSSPHPGAER